MNYTNRSLEGLRGAAAMLVVVFHMDFLGHVSGLARSGFLAVDLFFVLSGYVICLAYGPRLMNITDVVRFLIRRFGRLWPLHIVSTVLFYLVVSIPAALSGRPPVWPTLAEAFSLITMTNGFNLFDRNIGNSVSWSACDELYVYLLFAAVCVIFRKRSSVAFVALAVIGFAIAAWTNGEYCITHGSCFSMTYCFGWARCLAGFFIGALVANHRKLTVYLTRPTVQLAASMGALLFLHFAANVRPLAFAAPLVFGLFVATLTRDLGPVAALLHTRPLQYLGKISYALYMSHAVFRVYLLNMLADPRWHNQALWIATCGVGFLYASFALAHLLHRYIEIPARDWICSWGDSRIAHQAALLLRDLPENGGHRAEELSR